MAILWISKVFVGVDSDGIKENVIGGNVNELNASEQENVCFENGSKVSCQVWTFLELYTKVKN